MAAIALRIHPQTTFRYAPLEELTGDVVRLTAVSPEGNGQPVELFGIACQDPDGEINVFAIDDDGKRALIQQMTHGVIVP